MENNEKERNNTVQPNSGQVMDVKFTPAPVETPLIQDAEAARDPVSGEQPEIKDIAAGENTAPDNTFSEPTNPSEVNSNFLSPPTSEAHKTGAPIGVIIAAILVAVGLAAVTVYAYISSNDKESKPTQTNQQESTAPAVSPQDVDEMSNDVDSALNSTEEADFPDSELTDQSLGL